MLKVSTLDGRLGEVLSSDPIERVNECQGVDAVALGRLTDALDRLDTWRLPTASNVQARADALVNAAQEFGIKAQSQVTLHSDELWYPDVNTYFLHMKLQKNCEEFGYEH